MANFVIRTVTNGTVVVNGRQYRPSEQHKKYDGRLDGLRFAFGLYENKPEFVSLWGTEAAYKDEQPTGEEPHLVDGGYPWIWWYEIGA